MVPVFYATQEIFPKTPSENDTLADHNPVFTSVIMILFSLFHLYLPVRLGQTSWRFSLVGQVDMAKLLFNGSIRQITLVDGNGNLKNMFLDT